MIICLFTVYLDSPCPSFVYAHSISRLEGSYRRDIPLSRLRYVRLCIVDMVLCGRWLKSDLI
jgi:hypothetical protein